MQLRAFVNSGWRVAAAMAISGHPWRPLCSWNWVQARWLMPCKALWSKYRPAPTRGGQPGRLVADQPAAGGRSAPEMAEITDEGVTLRISKAAGEKCARCWHYETDIGTSAEHPEICGRCVTAIEPEPSAPRPGSRKSSAGRGPAGTCCDGIEGSLQQHSGFNCRCSAAAADRDQRRWDG